MKKRAGKRSRFLALLIAMSIVLAVSGTKTASGAGEEENIQIRQVSLSDNLNWHTTSRSGGRPESKGGIHKSIHIGENKVDCYFLINQKDDGTQQERRAFCLEPSVYFYEKNSRKLYPYRENTPEVFKILKNHYGVTEETFEKMGRAIVYFDHFNYPKSVDQVTTWIYMGDLEQDQNVVHPEKPEDSLSLLREKNSDIKELDGNVHDGNITLYQGLAEAELMAMRMGTLAGKPLVKVDRPGTYSFDPILAYAVPEMRAEVGQGSPLILEDDLSKPLERESAAVDTGKYTLTFTIPEDAENGEYEIKVIRPDYAGHYQWKFYSSHEKPDSPVEESCQFFGRMEGQPGEKEEIFKVKFARPVEDHPEKKPPKDDPSQPSHEDPKPDPPTLNEGDKEIESHNGNHASAAGNTSENENSTSYSTQIQIYYPDKNAPSPSKKEEKKANKTEKEDPDQKEKENPEKKRKEKTDRKKKKQEECYCRDPEKRKNEGDLCPCTDPDCPDCQEECLKEEEETQAPKKEKKKRNARLKAQTLAASEENKGEDQEKTFKNSFASEGKKKGKTNLQKDRLFSPETGSFSLLSLPLLGGSLMIGGSGLFLLKKQKRERSQKKPLKRPGQERRE